MLKSNGLAQLHESALGIGILVMDCAPHPLSSVTHFSLRLQLGWLDGNNRISYSIPP